ncbi:MAG: enolase C-terminal domain-like protein [Rubrivivax sp.]|nr:enolase C-terminal domain-like protein [Rubrivivax sp.]
MTTSALPLRLSLEAPRRLAAGTLFVRGTPRLREAVRIRLHDGQGTTGLGEALPLPGYSRDDADTAFAVLTELADKTLEVPREASGIAQIAATLAPFDAALVRAPSARFALECALLDLLSRRAGQSAAAWLAKGRQSRALQPVAVSVLLPDDEAGAVATAAQAAARGHTVLKLKVARADRSAAQEMALLGAVRAAADAAAPGAVRLRLDANGEMDPATLQQRLAAWSTFGIELIEEPLAGDALLALPALPLPWAADESLADPTRTAALLALPRYRGPAALVLKPAMLGLLRCFGLAEAAAARRLGVIVTHSLDGDLGFAAACALAQALPQPPWPCGLAPHAGLRRTVAPQAWLPVPTGLGLGVPDWD